MPTNNALLLSWRVSLHPPVGQACGLHWISRFNLFASNPACYSTIRQRVLARSQVVESGVLCFYSMGTEPCPPPFVFYSSLFPFYFFVGTSVLMDNTTSWAMNISFVLQRRMKKKLKTDGYPPSLSESWCLFFLWDPGFRGEATSYIGKEGMKRIFL